MVVEKEEVAVAGGNTRRCGAESKAARFHTERVPGSLRRPWRRRGADTRHTAGSRSLGVELTCRLRWRRRRRRRRWWRWHRGRCPIMRRVKLSHRGDATLLCPVARRGPRNYAGGSRCLSEQ